MSVGGSNIQIRSESGRSGSARPCRFVPLIGRVAPRFGAVGPRYTTQAFRHLGFGLIRQGFAPRRASSPFSRADAGSGQGITARSSRLKANVDHYAARRGLSLSVHAPTVKRGWSSVIETFNGNLLGT